MIEINIKLKEEARVLEAFGVGSSNRVREILIDYLNTVVNDYEQNVEVSKAVAAYTFTPLTEIVDESVEGEPEDPESPDEPPIEDPVEDPIEDPIDDPDEDPTDDPPVEDPEEPIE